MKINSLTKDEVFRSLVTSEKGLAEEEAKRRLLEFGHNEIEEIRKRPLIFKFLGQLTHFLAALLWIASLLSFLSEYLHPGEGMFSLGIAIIAVIFINAIFAFIQEYRAEKALEAMKRLLPFQVKILREGKEKEIPAREVVPGDVVMLAEGDKIPADLRLIDTNELMVNNAPLTGESESVARTKDVFPGDIINSPNIGFAGTTVISGSGNGVVFSTGMRTEFGRIAHLTSTVTSGISPLQREITRITRVVTAIAGVTGVVFFAIGVLIGRSFWDNFLFAIGIIIANVPEGLLPTVTLSLAMGSQRMAKRKALIKTLTSVETLGSVSVICTDKTGTLTQNKMAVRKAVSLCNDGPGKSSDISLFHIALLCNNTREIEGNLKGEPTEAALYSEAVKTIGHIDSKRTKEFPFDSERKRMSTINSLNSSVYVMAKGAPESILQICSRCRTKDGIAPMDDLLKERAVALYQSLMEEGLRVLAFAYREAGPDERISSWEDAEKEMVFTGIIGLEDPPRPEVPEAIQKCREAGIKIIMITGDGSRTALAIAREIRLVRGDTAVVVEGADFLKMSDAELRKVLSNDEIIFSRMTPKHKLRVVDALKEQGQRVAVTGDGINDAPALKRADIGISMGITGTDVAKEASDMILLDDNFATIVNAIEEGRAIFDNIQKFIIYIFAHLTAEAVPYILFMIARIPLPLTVMQILAIDLGTETIPALGLGVERPEPDIMKRPPRPTGKGLIDRNVLFRGYAFLGLIGTLGVLSAYFFVLFKEGWQWGIELPLNALLVHQASTATFLGIVMMQIGNVFACRTQKESVFRVGIFGNRLILWGILTEILLSVFIIYHPWGNKIFSTAPVSLSVWLLLVPFVLLLFFAEEVRKMFARKISSRPKAQGDFTGKQ